MCGADVVDAAVQSAHAAFEDWMETPPVERARVLFRYKMLLEDHFEELAALITREHGKTLTEARGDMRRGSRGGRVRLRRTELLKGESLENIARGIDCHTFANRRGLRGDLPLQFSGPGAHVDVSHGAGLREYLHPQAEREGSVDRHSADRIAGGSGIAEGRDEHRARRAECVDALLDHPLVKAISFVGSSAGGQVHSSRPAPKTANGCRRRAGPRISCSSCRTPRWTRRSTGMVDGAFGCAGQRCMAASTAVVVGEAPGRVSAALGRRHPGHPGRAHRS